MKFSVFSPHFLLLSLLQPHWRLVYAFLFGLAISAIQQIDWLIGLNCAAIITLLLTLIFNKKSLKPYFFRWLAINGFTLLIWLTMSWKISGQGIGFNPEGIRLALLISLRMNLILFIIWLCLMNVTDVILVQAIAKLPLPSKLIQLFILTVRYISLLGEINRKMDIAMRARGYQPKLDRRTVKVYAQRIVLLLIHAMLKAEKAEMALKARGFQFK
ncbi:cobalt/nickel transport system permease protein [Cricetibacter osteomyelitidis]|uniref:Cobalt/nickel transport system permease protein n=1 Tax=Cricetibacter osteomyelitidis TaxID=1521931 RepID=A0A4R2TK91_9PAST|nr:energy-coupling factor transporter transmembrane component T [Cricetibacter osteomyelitidis]TCP97708.1 cobalt/nickel transport system permease protein [Cricetibacter osteomyelitidis]